MTQRARKKKERTWRNQMRRLMATPDAELTEHGRAVKATWAALEFALFYPIPTRSHHEPAETH